MFRHQRPEPCPVQTARSRTRGRRTVNDLRLAARRRQLDLHCQLPGDPGIATLISAEQALLALTNVDRAANGLGPLEFDPDTLVIARARATSQIDIPALSHYNADGGLAFVKLLADAKVPYQLAGENLARAYDNDAAVTQRVEQALMGSPTHRKNILEQHVQPRSHRRRHGRQRPDHLRRGLPELDS